MEKVVEDASAGMGENLTVLKCPILHPPLYSPLTSAAFLSESAPRLIRVGTNLIVIDVSGLCITQKVSGKPTLFEGYRMP